MATGELTTQGRLSNYGTNKLENDKIVPYTEGNCWVVSAYNVLQSLADAKDEYKNKVSSYKIDKTKEDMPSINNIVSYNAKINEPNAYNQIYDSYGNNISGKITTSVGKTDYKKYKNEHSHFPKLYTSVRKFVDNTYKKFDNGTLYNTAEIINKVGSQYGYKFKAKGTIAVGLYGSSGITAVNNNLPFALCTSKASNAGYDNHVMAGCGYQIFSKRTGWWIFSSTSYKYFYELRDGHSDKQIFFDISAWIGFGGIVLLDYSIFNY